MRASPRFRAYLCTISHVNPYFITIRVQASDASLLVLSYPDAVSVTPSGARLEIPTELAPLVTPTTFILLNKTDLLPAPSALTPVLTALPQRCCHSCWAVSLASQTGTDEFLEGLGKALQDQCGFSFFAYRRI
jgi:tRNA modification GTPase